MNTNFKPFSLIGRGDIFNLVDIPQISLMKTGDDTAVYLQGVWIDNVLRPRGFPAKFSLTTCVIVPEGTELTIPLKKEDPIDPRRKFWSEGDQVMVGSDSRRPVNIFGGLFIYSGMGSGTYYSSVDNEIFWLTTDVAHQRAKSENVPFVHFDSMSFTSDPTLKHERKQAQEAFDRAAAQVAAVTQAAA
jgi:hypothetical protein